MTQTAQSATTRDAGFEAFSGGRPGNSGHNIYVSKAGVLQRIHVSDVSGNGYVDIPFANSHDDGIRLPLTQYVDPLSSLERIEIPSEGAFAGAVGDLTGDGYDDIVIANQFNGVHNELHAQVYFGGPDGHTRKRMLGLWAPSSKDVEIGDFDGSGRKQILFVSRERLRVFTPGPDGFHATGYIDIDLPSDIECLTAGDLDGDGIDDLVVRSTDMSVRVYWGGDGGLDPQRFLQLDSGLSGSGRIGTGLDTAAMGTVQARGASGNAASSLGASGRYVYKVPDRPRIKVLPLRGRPHLFLCPDDQATFVRITAERKAERSLTLTSGKVYSAATGDLRGTGQEDLVLAARQPDGRGGEQSWVYWGSEQGYDEDRRTAVPSQSANDVVTADLSGTGRDDVVICQDRTVEHYTTESLVYHGLDESARPDPIRLPTDCALDVLLVRPPKGGPPQPVFVNHLSNSARGHVDSYIYLGGPDGYRTERRWELRGWAATEMKFVDFTDNGYPDIYLANNNENDLDHVRGSYVFWGDREGFDLTAPTELPTDHNMSGVVADLNRNGHLDLVVSGFGHAEVLIFEAGDDGFGQPTRIPLEIDGVTHNQPRYMSLGDLNRNGWLDLVIPDVGVGGIIVLWGGPDGFSNERATVLNSGTTVSTRVADLDGNGWLDLVVGGFKGDDPRDDYRTCVYIYWGGPDGFSNHRRTELPAYFPVDVTVADFDNDGALDIFATNYHGLRTRDMDSYLYWGSPAGDFDPDRMTRLFHHSGCGALAADFDQDGYVDLAVANHKTRGNHPGHSYVWWNGPEGFSEERCTDLPTAGPHGLTHHDLGNVMDRSAQEYFESRVIELPDGARLTGVSWEGTVPAKTWVIAQVRCAERLEDLDAASWYGADGEGSWANGRGELLEGLPPGPFCQYRLALGAFNSVGTPRVTAVDLHHTI